MNFIEDLKYNLRKKNNHTLLIYINLFVFVIVAFFRVTAFLMDDNNFIIYWLGVPAYFDNFLSKPWTIITYMFTHNNFLHLLFNLLFLFWFGKIFVSYLTQRQLLGIYILGGIIGAIVYMMSFNWFPVFSDIKYASIAIGASASVMAIVIAIATLVPNHTIFMLFFGQVKIKYLAIGVVILDFLSIPTSNAGGHIAHLGGALTGLVFTYYYKKGIDITKGTLKVMDFLKTLFLPKKEIKMKHSSKGRPETDMEYNTRKKAEQEEIDKILDKIAKSGYKSLTEKEKEKLFKSSSNKK